MAEHGTDAPNATRPAAVTGFAPTSPPPIVILTPLAPRGNVTIATPITLV
jgi:hypothetical protein